MKITKWILTRRKKEFFVEEKLSNGIVKVFVQGFNNPLLVYQANKEKDVPKALASALWERWEYTRDNRPVLVRLRNNIIELPMQSLSHYSFVNGNIILNSGEYSTPILRKLVNQDINIYNAVYSNNAIICDVMSFDIVNHTEFVNKQSYRNVYG